MFVYSYINYLRDKITLACPKVGERYQLNNTFQWITPAKMLSLANIHPPDAIYAVNTAIGFVKSQALG